jgi:hypothetical protein
MAPFCAAFMIKPHDTLATQIGGYGRYDCCQSKACCLTAVPLKWRDAPSRRWQPGQERCLAGQADAKERSATRLTFLPQPL